MYSVFTECLTADLLSFLVLKLYLVSQIYVFFVMMCAKKCVLSDTDSEKRHERDPLECSVILKALLFQLMLLSEILFRKQPMLS